MTNPVYDYDMKNPGISEDIVWGNELIGRASIDPTTAVVDYSKNWITDYSSGYELYVLTGSAAGEIGTITNSGGDTITLSAGITGFVKGDWFAVVPTVKTERYPLPLNNLKLGLSLDKAREPMGYTGAGRVYRSMKEGLSKVTGSIDGEYICPNAFRNFESALFDGWVNYYTGEVNGITNKSTYCVQALQDDYTAPLGAGDYTDYTTYFNTGSGNVIFFPANEDSSDRFMIGCSQPFDSIYIKLDPNYKGVGGTVTVHYSKDGGTWSTTMAGAGNLTDGTSNLTQSGLISWIPPSDWVRTSYTQVESSAPTKYLYWISIKLNTTYTTNPQAVQCWVHYPQQSFTLAEPFPDITYPRYRMVTGITPTKFNIKVEDDKFVEVSYNYVAKNHIPSKVNFSTQPDGSRSYICYPPFHGNYHATHTFSNPSLPNISQSIRGVEISIDPTRDGKGKVSRGETGISEVLSGAVKAMIKFTLSERDYSFEDIYEALSGTSSGQVDYSLTLDNEISLGSPSVMGGVDAKTFTVSTTTAAKLHKGDEITVKESGQETLTYFIATVNTGTGVVTLVENFGKYNTATGTNDYPALAYTTGCTIYKRNYIKFSFTDLEFKDPDNRDVGFEGGEEIRIYEAYPVSYTGDNLSISIMP